MTKARKIAELISSRIISGGHLAGDKKHVGNPSMGVAFAADLGLEQEYEETAPLIGLEVVSVVYRDALPATETAAATEDEVVIYAKGRMTQAILGPMPDDIADVKITIEESTLVHVKPDVAHKYAPSALLYQRNARIACGSSCATATGFPGTIGALVTRDGEEGFFLLSCSHVLAACDYIRRGMPILSPATDDSKPDGPLPLAIARLTKSMPMQHGHYSHQNLCEIDAAIGKIENVDYVSSWQGNELGYDTPSQVVDPKFPMQVKKFGRSTGLTRGFLTGDTSSLLAVPYDAKDFTGTMWFKNHAMIASASRPPFALPGDSGSLVVTEDGQSAVGLLFSTNSKGDNAYIIPIRRVLEAFGATLVSGHNL